MNQDTCALCGDELCGELNQETGVCATCAGVQYE